MQNHLVRRGAMYYYRRRIPSDLLDHFNPKKELTKALGTSDRREAERLARALAVKHDEEFQTIRGAGCAPAITPAQSQASELLGTGVENNGHILGAPAQPPVVGDVLSVASRVLARLRVQREQAVLAGTVDRFMEQQRSALDWDKYALEGKVDAEFPAWKLEAFVIARQHLLEPGRYPALPVSATTPTAATMPPGESVSLTKLVEHWRNDRNPTNARTILKADLVVRRFVELQGDLPVHAVTRKHCVAFRDALRAEGQSIPNTNSYTDKLRALFAVAQARDLIKENPAMGLSLKDPTPKSKKRLPFDSTALVKVFTSPIYTEGERPKGGAGEAAFWLPLLSLFTGARLEELGQLAPEDVREEHYDDGNGNRASAWVIRLTDAGEEQGLKNASSVRRVPLHAELLRLGFVEFATARKGKARLFYELRPDTKGVETGLWSKWFGRWLRKTCGVTDERIVFHSFRHTFKDLCRDAGIPEDVHDALTGHSGSNGIARAYGSDRYPLRPLVQAIQKVCLPAPAQAIIGGLRS